MNDGRASVLLVDDRPSDLLALESILQPLDLNIIRAASGEEALKMLLEHDIEVILLDVQMPGLDGFQTATEIKKSAKTRDIPIIFLTAKPHQALQGYSTGAVDYISKPFDPWILKAKVTLFTDLCRKNTLLKHQSDLLASRLGKLEQEITERKLAEAALRHKTSIVELVKTVAIAANEARDIEEAMQTTVDAVCGYNGWPVGHVYLNDPNDGQLVSTGIWHLEDPERYSAFKKVTEAGTKVEALGPAGTARSSGRLEWMTDVTLDPAFSRAKEAGAAGLRSGFAFPLLVEHEVVGVFEFFAQHHAARDESFHDVIAPLATQLGHAVQRKRIEQELRHLDVAKTEFIGNAAHELRTPLSVLTGVTQILAKQHRKFSVKERDEMFAMMDRQSERMRTLINNLLDITGADFGRLKIELHPVPLREAVESALALNPQPDGWEVGTKIPDGLKVIADEARLDQVLTNLIQNAFKYGSERLRIEAETTTKDVRVSVCNLGASVPPELVDGLFDPFTRGEHQAARGSGLGLTICKRLIEAFGGSIWYEPNEAGGSRFEIRLTKA